MGIRMRPVTVVRRMHPTMMASSLSLCLAKGEVRTSRCQMHPWHRGRIVLCLSRMSSCTLTVQHVKMMQLITPLRPRRSPRASNQQRILLMRTKFPGIIQICTPFRILIRRTSSQPQKAIVLLFCFRIFIDGVQLRAHGRSTNLVVGFKCLDQSSHLTNTDRSCFPFAFIGGEKEKTSLRDFIQS